MFLSRFRRRKSTVVERVETYTAFVPGEIKAGDEITIRLPLTVDGALLATQIEHQLKQRGLT